MIQLRRSIGTGAVDREKEDTMSKKTKVLIGGAAVLALGAAAFAISRAEGDERGERSERRKTVQIGELPAPVQQAVQQQLQGAPVQRIEKRSEEGRTVYEVRTEREGKPTETVIGDDGRVLGSGAPGRDGDDDDD